MIYSGISFKIHFSVTNFICCHNYIINSFYLNYLLFYIIL
nr:MAG TPA: hypothetical protein [Caudoviricetes sp.]